MLRYFPESSIMMWLLLTVEGLNSPIFVISTFLTLCIISVSMLGGAVNGKAWSGYFDSLFDHKIRNLTQTYVAEWTIGKPIGGYPDFVAFGLIWIVIAVVALGAQCTAKFTSIFAMMNIVVLLFVTVSGFAVGNIDNWTNNSTGGFFPCGWYGVFAGSGSCFWAFTGFEVIAITNEEVINPAKMIPTGILLAILATTLLYVGTASGLTFMTSYVNLDTTAPLPSAFAANSKIYWGKYIASVGPLLGLTSTLVTTSYAYSRLLYAVSSDGLLPEFLSRLNSWTRAPLFGVIIGGSIMSLLALFLDLGDIIAFAVTLQLLQYLTICSCVIIMRYRPMVVQESPVKWTNKESDSDEEVVLLDVPKATNPQLKHSSNTKKSTNTEQYDSLSDDSIEKTKPVLITENSAVSHEKEQLLSDEEPTVTKGNTFSNHKMDASEELVLTKSVSTERDDAILAGKLKPSFSFLTSLWFPPPGM